MTFAASAAAVTLSDPNGGVQVQVFNLFTEIAEFNSVQTPEINGIIGQKIYGNGLFVSGIPFAPNNGTTNQRVIISAEGDASGTFVSDSVGVKWDFILSELEFCLTTNCLAASAGAASWEVTFTFVDAWANTYKFSEEGEGLGAIQGSGAIWGVNGVSPETWGIELTVDYEGFSGLIVEIPQNSLQIPGAINAVPEPSTYALMGAGLAAILWRRRRSA